MGLFRFILPAATIAAILAPTGEVQACSIGACEVTDRYTAFAAAHDAVATDGVLVFRTGRGNGELSNEEALEHVQIEVVDEEGNAIAGQLEAVAGSDLVLFRPEAPFVAGASLTATVTIDNDALDPDDCDVEGLAPFSFTVADEALPELALIDLQIEQDHLVTPSLALEDLVCCDGAYPVSYAGSCAPSEWTEGTCASRRGRGAVQAELALGLGQDSLLMSNTMVRLVAGEQSSADLASADVNLTLRRGEPFAVGYEVVNLVTGEVLPSDMITVGEDLSDKLGEIELDPSAELAAECSGEAYVCEVVEALDERWNREACEAWGTDGETDGETDTAGQDDAAAVGGCSTTGHGGRGADLMSLLALGGFALRRRRALLARKR